MPEGISRKELTKAITCLYVSFCSSVCKKQHIKQNRTEKKEKKGVTKSRGGSFTRVQTKAKSGSSKISNRGSLRCSLADGQVV